MKVNALWVDMCAQSVRKQEFLMQIIMYSDVLLKK